MKKIEIEPSSKAFSSGHADLALVGNLINGPTNLCEELEKEVPGQPLISHADVVKTALGLLCLGKSDFEARAEVAGDDPKKSLNQGIGDLQSGFRMYEGQSTRSQFTDSGFR